MPQYARAEVFAPATSANLGIGYDILGLALSNKGDRVIAEWREVPGAVIAEIHGDDDRLPHAADQNVVTIAANAVLNQLNIQQGMKITLHKGLPLGSGLGSSSASAVAGAVSANALFGSPLTLQELLPACLEGEAAVSGYHADNVAPCLLGGITLVTGTSVDRIQQLPVPTKLHLAFVKVGIEIPTAHARKVVPVSVPLNTMIHQTGMVAKFVDALHRDDLQALAMTIEADQVVEPARASLIPYLEDARSQAKAAGALAVFISGAGPTLCAICDDPAIAEDVADAMQKVYTSNQLKSMNFTDTVSEQGVRILHLE